jgi:hypothetical protein
MMQKKRVTKGNVGESFTIQIEGDSYTQSVRLLDVVGTGDGAQIFFSNPHFPDGRWGKIRCDRFGGKIWYNGRKVTIK